MGHQCPPLPSPPPSCNAICSLVRPSRAYPPPPALLSLPPSLPPSLTHPFTHPLTHSLTAPLLQFPWPLTHPPSLPACVELCSTLTEDNSTFYAFWWWQSGVSA